MSGKPTDKLVRFESFEEMPPAEPLSPALKSLTEQDIDRRVASDPDAGLIPPGFWLAAQSMGTENKEQITLRIDAEVLRHFRDTGKGYQARINAVLKSYVRAKQKAI